MSEFVDRDGSNIDIELWACLREDESYRIVAKHIFHDLDGVVLLTVWLGLVGLGGSHGELFGTGFSERRGWFEIATYSSESDAMDGHARSAEQLAKTGKLSLPSIS